MKIDESHRRALKEVVQKHKIVKEGIVANLFKRLLKSKLASSSDLMQAINKTDASMARLNKSIAKAENNGMVIPDELKQYLGIK